MNVSLQEHFKERLDLEKEITEQWRNSYRIEQKLLAEQCAERWAAHKEQHAQETRALELQAKEYERRLEHLNGEQARTKDILATYVPREIYENNERDWNHRVRDLENFRSNLLGRLVVLGGAVTVLAVGVGAIITRLMAGH